MSWDGTGPGGFFCGFPNDKNKNTYGSPGSVLKELREDVVQRDLDVGEHGRGVSRYLNVWM